ncbi:MAG: PqiC family protein, partial [Candidatus Binatia bacterium]
MAVWALLFAACGSFSAKPDPSRFFTLSALPAPEDAAKKAPGDSSGISLGIGPITLPGYLDRQEIVIRVAQNQINLAENDRWAEPLEENFSRVLSQNVAALLRADRVNAYPWP